MRLLATSDEDVVGYSTGLILEARGSLPFFSRVCLGIREDAWGGRANVPLLGHTGRIRICGILVELLMFR